MGRAARSGGWRSAEAGGLTDILAGQPADAALLAELYDLEHDTIVEDLTFYREWAGRSGGAVIDLGCGSGRLFASLLAGGATRVVGIDGSPALLARAEARIAAHADLRAALAAGRIELQVGDVRLLRRPDRFGLAILAGVMSHLDGPEDGLRALSAARRLLQDDGRLIVDVLGPGGLPLHDLPLSIDWEREFGAGRAVRRSSLQRRDTPEGVRVAYATLTDIARADGTMARLPASFRLWYPSPAALQALAVEAELAVEGLYGSHDLESLGDDSERCIVVLRPS